MSKHGQPMSQTLAQMHLNELKMNDPKLNKVFDKLKPKATVQLKTSSTIAKGDDFKTYLVVSKNTLRNGVEKITLKNRANPTGVKSFLYRRDGKVTFAIGDMGASIDDIKEKYSLINHEIIEDIEVEELDEMKEPFVVVDTADGNKVVATASDEKGAKSSIASAELPPIKIKDKKTLKVMKSKKKQMIGQPFNEEDEIDEGAAADARRGMSKDRDLVRRGKDSADVDDTASDADKKAAMKNMVMQMRQALDVKGNKPIEFEDGKKQKVDSKILNMLLKAHEMIPKPRDKEQFVKMISKSYRDMLKVSKMVGKQLRMGEEIVLDEGFSPKEIKMAIGIASDPRYKQGNYSGAVKQIEKIKKGLSTHKQVAAVLKRQNENLDENYRKLAMMGIGTETKKAAKVGLKTDYYLPKNGDKSFGKITRVSSTGYEITDEKTKKVYKFKFYDANNDPTSVRGTREEVELDEKYDLYHKSFSDAMQHAYDYAKKKLGITVDPKEIDNKVATGPKKPSEGKTNKYRLKGKGGNLQIQVYNKGGSKPFELNMYKEENEMTKSLKDTIVDMWSEAVSPAQQAAIAISKKEKEEQDEGNAFGAALQAARENGDETFVVSGKTYKCEDYDEKGQVKETNKNNKSDDGDGMDAVQPKAVKKKFKDRKDKDIDNDGDVDDSDKFLHKRRKAVSKAINSQKESIERYHETKRGSLRDTVLQMWGEGITEKKSLTKEKKDGIKNNMTDTGKEMSTVEVDAKMPKIKETKNKV